MKATISLLSVLLLSSCGVYVKNAPLPVDVKNANLNVNVTNPALPVDVTNAAPLRVDVQNFPSNTGYSVTHTRIVFPRLDQASGGAVAMYSFRPDRTFILEGVYTVAGRQAAFSIRTGNETFNFAPENAFSKYQFPITLQAGDILRVDVGNNERYYLTGYYEN